MDHWTVTPKGWTAQLPPLNPSPLGEGVGCVAWGGTVMSPCPPAELDHRAGSAEQHPPPASLSMKTLETTHINNLLEGRTVFAAHVQVWWIQQALNKCTSTQRLAGSLHLLKDSFQKRLSDLSGSKQILNPCSFLQGSVAGSRPRLPHGAPRALAAVPEKTVIFYRTQWQWPKHNLLPGNKGISL